MVGKALQQLLEIFQVCRRVPEEEIHEASHTSNSALRFPEFGTESCETFLAGFGSISESPQRRQDFGLFGLLENDETVYATSPHKRLIEARAAVGREADDGAARWCHVPVEEIEEAAARDAHMVLVARPLPIGSKREAQRVEVLHEENAVDAHGGHEFAANRVAHASQRQGVELTTVLEAERPHKAALPGTRYACKEEAELVYAPDAEVAIAVRQEAIDVLQQGLGLGGR